MDDSDDEHDDESLEARSAVVDDLDSDCLLRNTLVLAGIQHSVSNMSSDVHKSLSDWKEYYEQLKTLETFLRMEERRQRFVWTCVRGTQLAGHEFAFSNFKGSLSGQRWH